ncbi:hypothetical protein CEXT_497771 [Caerostris extrusa]|uniref:Uncharacterized protein n=1 Tax=Caerostris extrusa TaxID=172846 RepID=A0AAV4PYV7_CAEEX|nr:hypothetical protein CEXT_497771 [Caerostris extrusa]
MPFRQKDDVIPERSLECKGRITKNRVESMDRLLSQDNACPGRPYSSASCRSCMLRRIICRKLHRIELFTIYHGDVLSTQHF